MVHNKRSAPRFVGCCEIFDEIAEGGYATVYLGRWLGVGGFAKTVAIKRLHRQFVSSDKVLTMFANEARIVARIKHPNVTSTIDLVSHDQELFIVMDYIEGLPLSSLLQLSHEKGVPIPPAVTAKIMLDVLAGLQAAHDLKDVGGNAMHLVHRDVSPENIIVGVDGYARLLDFGVAKAVGMASTTQHGEVKGKLAYMSPEQLAAKPVTSATDVFAASIVLWEMLTRKRLFKAPSIAATAQNVLAKVVDPPSTHRPDLSKQLDEVVLRGLNRDWKERWRSASALAFALERASRVASTLEVVRWLRSLAQEELKERAELVRRVELAPINHKDAANYRHAADANRHGADIPEALNQDTQDEQRARPTRPLLPEAVTREFIPKAKGNGYDKLSFAPTSPAALFANKKLGEKGNVTAGPHQGEPAVAKHRSTTPLPRTASPPASATSTPPPPQVLPIQR